MTSYDLAKQLKDAGRPQPKEEDAQILMDHDGWPRDEGHGEMKIIEAIQALQHSLEECQIYPDQIMIELNRHAFGLLKYECQSVQLVLDRNKKLPDDEIHISGVVVKRALDLHKLVKDTGR